MEKNGMDNSYIESLRKDVKRALKSDKMRFRHTIGVADTSACLARSEERR